uniref:Uncharacterized protein n=1 Tax=Triticum urartu TaxID=4572 RepID=A0A8R7UEM0_TRIUA
MRKDDLKLMHERSIIETCLQVHQMEAESILLTNSRGRQTAANGVAIGIVSPPPSAMSMVSPSPTSHSKHCRSAASVKLTTRMASPSPGHRLLPSPNGSMGMVTASLPKNLSGLNTSGASQTLASRWTVHAFTRIIVPRCTWKPPTVQSSMASCAGMTGPTGQSRSVSLTTHCR